MMSSERERNWDKEFICGRNYSYESHAWSILFVGTRYPVDIQHALSYGYVAMRNASCKDALFAIRLRMYNTGTTSSVNGGECRYVIMYLNISLCRFYSFYYLSFAYIYNKFVSKSQNCCIYQ